MGVFFFESSRAHRLPEMAMLCGGHTQSRAKQGCAVPEATACCGAQARPAIWKHHVMIWTSPNSMGPIAAANGFQNTTNCPPVAQRSDRQQRRRQQRRPCPPPQPVPSTASISGVAQLSPFFRFPRDIPSLTLPAVELHGQPARQRAGRPAYRTDTVQVPAAALVSVIASFSTPPPTGPLAVGGGGGFPRPPFLTHSFFVASKETGRLSDVEEQPAAQSLEQ
jgi:hypothetical protein